MTMTLDPPAIPGFRLGHPEVTPRLPFTDALPALSITEKHRPKLLADVVGQGDAVFRLMTFLDAPHPAAFLFSGPTGVGKTSMAYALAAELGLSPHSPDLIVIESGRQDGDAVEWILDLFRFPPMYGGYRVVVVNEADMMTPAASRLWLSGLESIPQRTIIVMTTNAPEKFPDRFIDRLIHLDFASDGATLAQDAQALIDRIWRAETGRDDAPRVGELPNVVDKNGCISFRRSVAALDPLIRAHARRHRDTMPTSDGPTVAMATPHASTVPVAPSVAVTPPIAPAATVERPKRVRTPRKPASAPAVLSIDLGIGQRRLDAALAAYDRLCDVAYESFERIQAARAERKGSTGERRREINARLAALDDEHCRIGYLCIDAEAEIKAARRALKRTQRAAL